MYTADSVQCYHLHTVPAVYQQELKNKYSMEIGQ